MPITRYKRTRFWAVWDAAGQLICVCVYRKGAEEVASAVGPTLARRLALLPPLASDSCWQCKAELPALADAASPCPLCGAELLLL